MAPRSTSTSRIAIQMFAWGKGLPASISRRWENCQPSSQEYSRILTSSLSRTGCTDCLAQALTSAQPELSLAGAPVDRPARGLQSLHWESINNPQDSSPLASGENLLFSRYLSSLDWRPVRLRPPADLRALVVISNPSNL